MILNCTSSSTIIEDVTHRLREEQNTALLYHYFDFGNKISSSAENLLRSLVAQLVKQTSRFPKALDKLTQQKFGDTRYGTRIKTQAESVAQPSLLELSDIIYDSMEEFDHVYLILDALDECGERQKVLSVVRRLLRSRIGKIHILITSRSDADLEEHIVSMATAHVLIEGNLIEPDIRSYIQEQLHNNPKLRRWPLKIQRKIESALMTGAQGMYVANDSDRAPLLIASTGFAGWHAKSRYSPGARCSNSSNLHLRPLRRT